MMKLGTDGFRGVIGVDFTKENVCKIIQCACDIIKKKKFKNEVVVGYDNRFMSEHYAKWISEVLVANGIKVLLTDSSVPTPLVSFATKYLHNQMGMMVTASHNPYTFNGVKFFTREGRGIEPDIEEAFNKMLNKTKKVKSVDFEAALSQGKIVLSNFTKEYVKNITNLLKNKKGYNSKVAFNVLNGSSLCAIHQFIKQLKLTSVELFETNRDVGFKLSGPIPDEAHLKDFRQTVIDGKYDFAFATDGDGDRLAVIDDKGNFHDGNILCPLIYHFAITQKKQKGAFVKSLAFSHVADVLCEKLGTKIIQTPVGFKHLTKQLVENNALIGAEPTGFEINSHVYTKDGLVVFALILEIVEFYKKPLSQIIEDFKNYLGYDTKYIEHAFRINNKYAVIKALQNNNPNFSKKIVDRLTIDGYKYIFEDGSWALIRLSGTEDLIKIVSEQPTQKEINKVVKEAKNYILSL